MGLQRYSTRQTGISSSALHDNRAQAHTHTHTHTHTQGSGLPWTCCKEKDCKVQSWFLCLSDSFSCNITACMFIINTLSLWIEVILLFYIIIVHLIHFWISCLPLFLNKRILALNTGFDIYDFWLFQLLVMESLKQQYPWPAASKKRNLRMHVNTLHKTAILVIFSGENVLWFSLWCPTTALPQLCDLWRFLKTEAAAAAAGSCWGHFC